MKKASILIAALFVLSVAPFATPTAEAQSRGHVKKSERTTKKRTRTTRHHSHRSRTHTGHHRHHTRHHHHSRHYRHHHGAHVRLHVGWPYHHTYHRHHVHRHTIVYDRTPDVVVVEPEPGFTMPTLNCPIRTDEVRSGFQQWCATGRGTKHGTYRRWYDDGVLAAEGEYEYDTKDGVWVEYHPNGAIREEGEFRNGKRTGTWVTWGSDGQELVAVDY